MIILSSKVLDPSSLSNKNKALLLFLFLSVITKYRQDKSFNIIKTILNSMYEHGKKVLGHIGSSHSPEREANMEVGHHNEALGEHEKRALEGKKHHKEESF